MMAAWRATTLAPFKSRIFLAIWTTSLISNFGSLIQAVGASWLMTSIGRSPDIVALVQTSTVLPLLLLSLPAGALADIWDHRLTMLIALGVMLTVSLALAVATYSGHMTPWTLLLFTFLLGCGVAMYGPAWQSSVGEQVPRQDLSAAVSLNALAYNIARTVGPAIGGIIVATAGPPAAFVVNAISYVGLIVVLLAWRRHNQPRVLPPESMWLAMHAGLKYALLSPAIHAVLIRGFFFGLTGSAIWALMPLIARDLLSGSALTYGALVGAFGVGAMIGALTAAFIRHRLSNQTIIMLAVGAFGLGTTGVALSSHLALTMALLSIAGMAWVLVQSTLSIAAQISSPRWVVGRALAIHQMSTFGGVSMGSWMFGELAGKYGIRTALTISGTATVLSALMGYKFKLPHTGHLNLDPVRANPARSTLIPSNMAAEVELQSGPVVVAVEYRIAEENRDAFVLTMQEVRRIRRRNGAQRWTLLQDIDDPSLWTERFQSPTWLEYLRLRQRVTMADREVTLKVHTLHRGEEGPQVRHLLERTGHSKSEAERISERASVQDPNLPPTVLAENRSPS